MKILVLVVLAFCLAELGFSQENLPLEKSAMNTSVTSLVEDVSETNLKLLQKSEDHEIALKAAWRLFFDDPSGKIDLSTKEKVGWLCGYMDGKLSASVPSWWKEIAGNAKRGNRGQAFFSRGDYWPFQENKLPHVSDFVELHGTSNAKVLEVAGRKIPLDEQIFAKGKKQHGSIDVVIAVRRGGAIYFATLANHASPYTLWKLDAKTAEILWSSTIEGGTLTPSQQGRGFHFSEIVFDENENVFVFGASSSVVYIHKISSAEGKEVFRFRSNWRE